MNKRDNRELAWRQYQEHWYQEPAADLARYVQTYWRASWCYATPYQQVIVPLPVVNLSYRAGVVEVHGVPRGRVLKQLAGRGQAFGVTFRPGRFRGFLGAAVRSITGRSVPAATVFTGLPDRPEPPLIDDLLRRQLPGPDPAADLAAEVVEAIAAEPGIQRVDELADRYGLGVRSLERLFAEHVGIGPKWVIRRYRLREATARMEAAQPVDWADLAANLGYADQAHLSRDFTRMFGEPPTRYAARYPG